MGLDDLQRNWNEWGRRDPYWAILARPDRSGNRWDLDEFLTTGVDEINHLLEWLHELHVEVRPGRALDFGCGVGRLTQALSQTFAECDGVDIAPSMIARANELNRFGDRCRYHVNDRDDLALFDDGAFDLIYSDIVLQHIAPEFAAAYIREFTRVLAPGGVVAFQLPSHLLGPGEEGLRPHSIADDGFRAEITPANAALDVEEGAIEKIAVSVRNTSAVPWADDRFVNLGNHWRDHEGAILRFDDGRATIAATVEPGETVEIFLEIQAPTETGEYLLELDLVIEGVTWFADRGSPTVIIPVHVAPRLSAAADEHDELVPVMEMHGIPREQVESELRAGGLHIVLVQESGKAAGWRDYWYIAVKPAAGRQRRRRLRSLLSKR